jgi:hypothetical protein
MSNAFDIPKQSSLLAQTPRMFKQPRCVSGKMPQIALPGSLKNLPPAFMQNKRDKPATKKSSDES